MSSHRRTLAAGLATAAASSRFTPFSPAVSGSWPGSARSPWSPRRARRPACAAARARLLLGGLVALLLYLNLAFSNARSFRTCCRRSPRSGSSGNWSARGSTSRPLRPRSPSCPACCCSRPAVSGSRPCSPTGSRSGLAAPRWPGCRCCCCSWSRSRSASAAASSAPPWRSRRRRRLSGAAQQRGQGPDQGVGAPGPVRPRRPRHRALAAAGRRVGFASVVIALFLPLVIPGLHVTRLFGGQPGIGGHGARAVAAPGAGGVGFPGVDTVLSQQLNQELGSAGRACWCTPPPRTPLTTCSSTCSTGSLTPAGACSAAGVSMHAARALPSPPVLEDARIRQEENRRSGSPATSGPTTWARCRCPTRRSRSGPRGTWRPTSQPSCSLTRAPRWPACSTRSPAWPIPRPSEVLNSARPPSAAIEKNYTQVPAGYDSLRTLAESVVAGAGGQDHIREGRRAAELAGEREHSSTP